LEIPNLDEMQQNWTTGEKVIRDRFLSGNSAGEKKAQEISEGIIKHVVM